MARNSHHQWFSFRNAASRRLRIERLEDRQLLSITVNTLVDENNGIGVGGISLREAVAAAAPSETINFSVTGTIHLRGGQLDINKNLAIDGPGANLLTIDPLFTSRVFDIAAGPNNVVIDGLTINRGRPAPGQNGGAIRSQSTGLLSIQDCVITDSRAGSGGGLPTSGGSGGGIWSSGPLEVTGSTISGNRSGNGGVSANGAVGLNGGEGAGIFSSGTLTVVGSTISGNVTGIGGNGALVDGDYGAGGGVRSSGTFTLTNSTVSGNSARFGGGILTSSGGMMNVVGSTISNNNAAKGGGIAQFSGQLTVSSSSISENSSNDGNGGGIYAQSGITMLDSSTISNNSAHSGGGIYIRAGSATLTGCTISGNWANGSGGGIANLGDLVVGGSTISGNVANNRGGGVYTGAVSMSPTARITSSTISGNFANSQGGGLFNLTGQATVRHSTIHNNSTPNGANAGITSAGDFSMAALTQVYSSIVAGNGTSDIDFVNGPFNSFESLGYNLICTGNALSDFNQPGDQIGADPLLGLLADNGGPTRTHRPLSGSPAIDAGNPAAVAGGNSPFFDQRGLPFPRVFDGNAIGGPRIDIGAYEVQPVANLTLVVDTLVDEYDGNFSAGDLSLREAIGLANGSNGANTITFAPSLAGGTITLQLGQLEIADSLTVNGLGASLLTIDAAGNDPTPALNNSDGSRVFNIDDGSASTLIAVEIVGLTLTGGDSLFYGGAIHSSENLSISSSTVSGNATYVHGGGIMNFGGDLTVTNCTISENIAGAGGSAAPDAAGGGIWSSGGLTVAGSTISGNSALDHGGGIMADGDLSVMNSSIIGNLAGDDGGGIRSYGEMSVTNSTISDNSAADDGGGIRSNGNLTVSNSTISDNSAPDDGGGILNTGNLTVTGSTITGNSTDDGGGIGHTSGDLIVTNSTITGNSALDDGGGIRSSGIVTVTNSTISGNTALGGGGIYSGYGQLTLTNTTVSGNTASYGGGLLGVNSISISVIRSSISGNQAPHSNGGGIEVVNSTLNVTNSTISGNSSGAGGGILSYHSTTTINNSTITGNNGTFAGGGINVTGPGPTTLSHTIVAGNTGVGATRNDIAGAVTADYTLIGVNTGATITNNGGNLIGTAALPKNPLLGPLADNGGPTMTHALLSGSPAIDTGHPTFMQVPDTDQRGAPFVRIADGDGVGGNRVDLGAFELQPLPPAFGDFTEDAVVDAADYIVWRKTLGNSVPKYSGADADGDGVIDQDDYSVWRAHFGTSLPMPGAGVATRSAPAIPVGEATALVSAESASEPVETSAARAAGFAALDSPSHWQDSGLRSRGHIQRYGLAKSGRDDLLLLAIDRVGRSSPQGLALVDDRERDDVHTDHQNSPWFVDDSPTVALSEWRGACGNSSLVRN